MREALRTRTRVTPWVTGSAHTVTSSMKPKIRVACVASRVRLAGSTEITFHRGIDSMLASASVRILPGAAV